ncbi:hypothetical protein CPC08DRAFT_730017 [Agrocybe pediades]|nr:hypothetical protein CPC08DRAFT_730017 [Agrocybe pediades]
MYEVDASRARLARQIQDRDPVHLSTAPRNTVTHNDLIVVPTIRDCYSILKFAHYLSPFINMLQFFITGKLFFWLESPTVNARTPNAAHRRVPISNSASGSKVCEQSASISTICEPRSVLACSQAARRFLFARRKGVVTSLLILNIKCLTMTFKKEIRGFLPVLQFTGREMTNAAGLDG